MKFLKKDIFIIFIVFVSLIITNCSYKNINYDTGPDLIIEIVNIIVNSEEGKDKSGMPVRTGYKSLDITVRIKNIGTKPFNSSLYIASTNSEQDFQMNYFNSFTLVEPDPIRILPNKSIEHKFIKRVERNSSNIRLQVNYHSAQENIAKEINFSNNTYSSNY